MMAAGGIEDIYRLSPMQEGMLFDSLRAPGSGVYVEQHACTLSGEVDPAALRRAWEWAVGRHAALRASFHWQEADRPVQVIHGAVELPWAEEDWRGLDPAARAARRAIRATRAPTPWKSTPWCCKESCG